MTRNERLAWNKFLSDCEAQKQRALDGCIPIAMIALPIKHDNPTDIGLVIDINAAPIILWPANLSEEDRSVIIQRIAEAYKANKVENR